MTTYGIARNLVDWPSSLSIILQCFGGPESHSRRQVASLEKAIFLDAAAVCVQLSWTDPEIDRRIPEICAFTSDAHSAGMPVLFMVGNVDKSSDLPRTIRICQEMGADLIKVGFPKDNFASVDDLKTVLRESPPVLMAGGSASLDIIDTARRVSELGFAGFCVGRHIFNSRTPVQLAMELNEIFSHSTKQKIQS